MCASEKEGRCCGRPRFINLGIDCVALRCVCAGRHRRRSPCTVGRRCGRRAAIPGSLAGRRRRPASVRFGGCRGRAWQFSGAGPDRSGSPSDTANSPPQQWKARRQAVSGARPGEPPPHSSKTSARLPCASPTTTSKPVHTLLAATTRDSICAGNVKRSSATLTQLSSLLPHPTTAFPHPHPHRTRNPAPPQPWTPISKPCSPTSTPSSPTTRWATCPMPRRPGPTTRTLPAYRPSAKLPRPSPSCSSRLRARWMPPSRTRSSSSWRNGSTSTPKPTVARGGVRRR